MCQIPVHTAGGWRVIGDGRPEDAPPRDDLAEAIVLSKLLIKPARVDTVDLASLLVFPDSQLCWQAMVVARAQYPDVSSTADRGWSDFFAYWLTGLNADPVKSLERAAGVLCSDDFSRALDEHEQACDDDEGFLLKDHIHSYEWWLERLQRIRQARALIDAAQKISEGAWRMPDHLFTVDHALKILRKVPTLKVSYEDGSMDIPV